MIARITGQVIWRADKFVIIDVLGVGYRVFVSPETLVKVKKSESASFWTHLHVREDAQDLYGFPDREELEFFELLIGISGIGPKSALSVIGVAPIETLKKAVASGDTSYLTKVSGVGKKTAEKIVLELRDKLSALGHKAEAGEFKGELDALEALQTLGYSQAEARDALKQVSADLLSTSDRLKSALKILGQK